MKQSSVKIAFMTTVGVNVGDEFIREGICSFLDNIIPQWLPFYVNKHDLTTLHTRVYDETTLLADKFQDADIIIQAGAPVYWKIGDSTSYNVEWAEELWRKRIFRIGTEKPILNVAAGACQPYPDTAQTFLADPLCVDFANKTAAACRWTSVRDPLASQILLALGHDHAALPCAAFHAARRVQTTPEPDNIIGINLMPMGGHFRLQEDVDENSWKATIAPFLAAARRRRRLLFIAHDQLELDFMNTFRQGEEQVFYATDYREYFPVYAGCEAVIANRVHGAVCAAGFGTPSMIIGNDTRLLIGDFIGLPSYYVAEVTAETIISHLDDFLANRKKERDRLLTLREESARIYTAAIGQTLAAAGFEPATNHFAAVKGRVRGGLNGTDPAIESIHRTLSGFAHRLSLDSPDSASAPILKELLSCPERRNFIRNGASILLIGTDACPLAWFVASLGAHVTLTPPEQGSTNNGRPDSLARNHIKLSRRDARDEKITLKDSSFDIVIVCVDKNGMISEALRLLRPTGIGIMPACDEKELLGQKIIAGTPKTVLGYKTFPLGPHARILIPRFDTFGDIVILEGFLQAFRRKFADADICLLVRQGYHELAELFPPELNLRWMTVDHQAYICPDDRQRAEFTQRLREIRAEGWDAVLTTTYSRTWLDELLLNEFADINTILLGSETDARNLSTDNRIVVLVEEWTYETKKYQILLERLTGDSTAPPLPCLAISPALAKQTEQELSALGLAEKRFVACLPAGTQNQKHKVWPLERYAKILCWLNESYGLEPLLVGHISEETPLRSLTGMLAAKGVTARNWLGRAGDVPKLGALLQKAALFVGNDSGPMHIASALGVPVVGIFGGGTYPRFIPQQRQAVAVVAELPCFGCYWECIFGDAPCMRMVHAESVKTGVELLLKNEIPTENILNIGAQLPNALVEIVERAKNELGNYKQRLYNERRQFQEETTTYMNILQHEEKLSFPHASGENPSCNSMKVLDPTQKPSGMAVILQEARTMRAVRRVASKLRRLIAWL